MKRYENVIWEGRFQPIHLGHVAYIRRLLELGERVFVIVVANQTSDQVVSSPSELPVPEFTAAVDPHHRAEKNPLPHWVRFVAVRDTLAAELGAGAPVYVSFGPRLDLAWSAYRDSLPPDRVFVTPTRDAFEDIKAAAWTRLGERCERLDVSDLPAVSATLLRERIRGGGSLDGLISPRTIVTLQQLGCWDVLRGKLAGAA